MGNVLVHAQVLPSMPSTPDVSSRIPDQALRTLDFSPSQLVDIPQSAQQDFARRQAELRSTVLENQRNQNPAARGGVALTPNNNGPATSSAQPSGNESSGTTSSTEAGQSPLTLSRGYLQADNDLTQANIAQTLALATAADIQLWKGYYGDMYTKVEETKRSYERVRDSLRRYKTQLSTTLSQLPTTILSCLY